MIVYDATNVYGFKRAVFDQLQLAAGGAGPLSALGVGGGPVQVLYDRRSRDLEDICIYGAGVTFSRDPENSVVEGLKHVDYELTTTSWFIVVRDEPGVPVEKLEERAEQISVAVEEAVLYLPDSWMISGQGDYGYDAENIVQLRLDIQSQAMIKTGV